MGIKRCSYNGQGGVASAAARTCQGAARCGQDRLVKLPLHIWEVVTCENALRTYGLNFHSKVFRKINLMISWFFIFTNFWNNFYTSEVLGIFLSGNFPNVLYIPRGNFPQVKLGLLRPRRLGTERCSCKTGFEKVPNITSEIRIQSVFFLKCMVPLIFQPSHCWNKKRQVVFKALFWMVKPV